MDVVVFKELIQAAEVENDRHKKLKMLKNACQLYVGEFLQKLSGDEWVLMEGVQCKNLYAYALQEMCDLLKVNKEYEEVIQVVDLACKWYPFDEWRYIR